MRRIEPLSKVPIIFRVGQCRRQTFRAAIVQLVDDLLNTTPFNTSNGLCAHVSYHLGNRTNINLDCYHSLRDSLYRYIQTVVFASWEHYSGNRIYPVPDTRLNHQSPRACYHTTRNLWDKRTKYGKLRWDLLYYTCEQLLEQVADE